MAGRRSVGLVVPQSIGVDISRPPDPLIAVTNEGPVLRSPDAIDWLSSDPGDPDGIFIGGFQGGFAGDVIWVKELGFFIAGVRSSGWGGDPDPTLAHIATSSDGIHWTRYLPPDGFVTIGLAVAPGPIIVAGGRNGSATSRIMRSTNGVDWTIQTDPSFSGYGGHAVWDGHKFLMVGDNYISSPDGETWAVEHDFAGASFGNDLVWAEELGLWLTCGFADTSGYCVATSPDGSTWTGHSSPFDDPGFVSKIAWNGSLFVATGYDGAFNYSIMTSPDGSTWTARSTPVDRAGFAFGPAVIWIDKLSLWVVAMNGTFVSGGGGYHIVTSPDGITWTDRYNFANLVEGFASNF